MIPVSDFDRPKVFYGTLGWRLDADFRFDNGFHIVQFTPPDSGTSIQFGNGSTARLSGPSPDHPSYGSFATFSDPDGNSWLLQEITTRLADALSLAGPFWLRRPI